MAAAASVHADQADTQAERREEADWFVNRLGPCLGALPHHEVRAWKARAYRSYNWAARGRSAQDAVWHQRVACEAAASQGHAVYADLYDLWKACEAMPLENVWRAGLKMHFPPEIFRLEIETFAAARTVVVNGACADPINTLSALVAGGSFATECLFLFLAGPCDGPSCVADGAENECM